MSIKVSGGLREDGVVIGNTFDKYGSRNPLVRRMMSGFENALDELVARAAPTSIHEVGCGEGYWALKMWQQGLAVRGSDFSSRIVAIAQQNAASIGAPTEMFHQRSAYELQPGIDGADLVVCCEVLEHLDDPRAALRVLRAIAGRHVLLSVPREPLWSILNVSRGRYLSRLGNTPGHVQQWSAARFISLVATEFDVLEVRQPLPWTMALCSPRIAA